MKTFEEKLAAWLDGRLTGPELAAFERELEARPEVMNETPEDLLLGDLLREHRLPAPPLRNADFFNHQILRQIAAEARPAAPLPSRPAPLWTLPRMAFSGAFLLLLSTALYFAAVPKTRLGVRHNEQYVQNILSGRSSDPAVTITSLDPGITATSFHSKEDNVNVVWLDGLNYMPRDHKLK